MLRLLKLSDITCFEGMAVILLATGIVLLVRKLITDIPEIIRKMKQEQNKE